MNVDRLRQGIAADWRRGNGCRIERGPDPSGRAVLVDLGALAEAADDGGERVRTVGGWWVAPMLAAKDTRTGRTMPIRAVRTYIVDDR